MEGILGKRREKEEEEEEVLKAWRGEIEKVGGGRERGKL